MDDINASSTQLTNPSHQNLPPMEEDPAPSGAVEPNATPSRLGLILLPPSRLTSPPLETEGPAPPSGENADPSRAGQLSPSAETGADKQAGVTPCRDPALAHPSDGSPALAKHLLILESHLQGDREATLSPLQEDHSSARTDGTSSGCQPQNPAKTFPGKGKRLVYPYTAFQGSPDQRRTWRVPPSSSGTSDFCLHSCLAFKLTTPLDYFAGHPGTSRGEGILSPPLSPERLSDYLGDFSDPAHTKAQLLKVIGKLAAGKRKAEADAEALRHYIDHRLDALEGDLARRTLGDENEEEISPARHIARAHDQVHLLERELEALTNSIYPRKGFGGKRRDGHPQP